MSISKQDIDEISKSLFNFLASTYALYLKTQNFHWNVKGATFISLHQLFEKQYDELAEAIDEIAERAAILGTYVDGSFSSFSEHSIIKDAKKNLTSEQMLKELVEGHEAISELGRPLTKRFQDLNDEVSADLMIRRLTFHETAIWMLKSHLQAKVLQ